MATDHRAALSVSELDGLLSRLADDGRQVLGPVHRNGAVVFDRIRGVEDLPKGITDIQSPGQYRTAPTAGDALFAHAAGPQSAKKYFHRPEEHLFTARRTPEGLKILGQAPTPEPRALVGLRACDLAALTRQDRVLMGGAATDDRYARHRSDVFVVAVACTRSAGNCFCASMGTGPRPSEAFDLSLTELFVDGDHRFVVEAGSPAGRQMLARISARPASPEDEALADRLVEETAAGMKKRLDPPDARGLLHGNREHPQWETVAQRCLGCGNCTLVCPTCFCTTVEERVSLDGQAADHVRRWDSCFTMDFSFIHGGSVRPSLSARYRHWITHKLASWHDQFGTSGCVGCGRCITWCPVGIDITEEVRAVARADRRAQSAAES